MTDLTRRRFVSLLGALPFVGPALLAVASKAASSGVGEDGFGFGLNMSPSVADMHGIENLRPKWHSYGKVVVIDYDLNGEPVAVDSYWERDGERIS